jgi:hypothetical protein
MTSIKKKNSYSIQKDIDRNKKKKSIENNKNSAQTRVVKSLSLQKIFENQLSRIKQKSFIQEFKKRNNIRILRKNNDIRLLKKIKNPKERRRWEKKITLQKIHQRVKLNVMNNTYDVNIQTEIRSLKWIMYKVHKEYMYALKSGIIASFFRELKETKQRFYRKSKAEKKENYGEFQLSKVKLNEKKEEKLKKMFLQKQRIYPRLSQVYYLLCRQGLFTILKKRIRYYMKNFFNRIAKICLVLFNFNSQSSAYISASLAKRRFELKFSKKEVSMMLYHVTQEYVSGFYAVLAGRFTKNIRATKEQHLFVKLVRIRSLLLLIIIKLPLLFVMAPPRQNFN